MTDLYPYQEEGISWLAQRLTAFLADEMGLGKSVEAIRAADRIKALKILVICPASLREDWRVKFHEWSLIRRPIHVLAPDAQVHLGGEAYVLIVGYEGAIGHRKALRNLRWDLIVLDEAQYLKSPTTKRTRGVYGGYCNGFDQAIIQNARRVWALSGTPMVRDVRDLYPHLRALRPASIMDPNTGQPMSPSAFTDRYCQLDPTLGEKVVANRNVEELSGVLNSFMLRRTVAEVMPDLPELRFVNLYVAPDEPTEALATAQWPKLQVELEQMLSAARDGDVDWAMQQHISTIRRLTGLVKASLAVKLLHDELIASKDQFVVFAHHRDVLYTISDALDKQYGAGLFYGGLSDRERDTLVRRFQAGELRVLCIQLQAGGVGLTLTSAHQALFVESSWNPTDNWQAAARLRRIGQKFPVLARFMTLTGTIDEPIQRVSVRKANQIREVLTR